MRPNPAKIARNARIRSLVLDAGWTYERAGAEYGLTRERVRQILAATGDRSPRSYTKREASA